MEDTPDKREYVGAMEQRRSVEGNIQAVVQSGRTSKDADRGSVSKYRGNSPDDGEFIP